MLPPAALQKSGSYAVELERWARIFPRSQIKARHRPRHRLRHRPRRRVGESRCAHGESAPGSLTGVRWERDEARHTRALTPTCGLEGDRDGRAHARVAAHHERDVRLSAAAAHAHRQPVALLRPRQGGRDGRAARVRAEHHHRARLDEITRACPGVRTRRRSPSPSGEVQSVRRDAATLHSWSGPSPLPMLKASAARLSAGTTRASTRTSSRRSSRSATASQIAVTRTMRPPARTSTASSRACRRGCADSSSRTTGGCTASSAGTLAGEKVPLAGRADVVAVLPASCDRASSVAPPIRVLAGATARPSQMRIARNILSVAGQRREPAVGRAL